jgi:single-stranded-DNA-specific exonuclease
VKIIDRTVDENARRELIAEGIHPVLARIYAARAIRSAADLDYRPDKLLAPNLMKGIEDAARLLADAIIAKKKLLIVADYDADGATACAVGLRALRGFGADVSYLAPNRFEYGYGLTPEIAALAYARFRPDVLITVDNGIASVEGVLEANRLGMVVLITDHHLPGDRLPPAACIINPNQPGCGFPSKHLAGVGVMFYLMLALRAELRRRGAFAAKAEPNLAELLPLVALGTVADVVALDQNNRVLVQQGLQRIRAARMQPGLAALFEVAGRDARRATARDLGFAVGPRLNAAGRLTDMAVGIECLATDEVARARAIAVDLDRLNRERRAIETEMQEDALAAVEARDYGDGYTLSLYDPAWHQGVVGILAGRIRERFHRPAIAFARGDAGAIRGSGRSIPALHLRDALDRVAVRNPGLLVKFGGHAAAAGLTLREADFGRFRDAFEEVARALLSPADLERVIETDGALAPDELSLETVEMLAGPAWGAGFPAPRFCDEFSVVAQRIVGEQHLKLALALGSRRIEAIRYRWTEPAPARVRAVYHPALNEFDGLRSLQLTIEHWEPLSG